MCDITRRGFMAGCSASIAALAGSRFNTLAFAQEPGASETLVVLFLRGGVDGLDFMPPIGGADRGLYEAARPTLQVPVSGPEAAIPLGGSPFGLHPEAAPLVDLFDNNSLAIIQATGHNVANRSHFDAMEFMELGTPGINTTPTGWLTRHLQSSAGIPDEIIMPTLAMGGLQQSSLRGDYDAVNLIDPDIFRLSTGPWRWRPAQRTSLRRLYGFESTPLHVSGTKALDAVDVIELYVSDDYDPANGAVYPTTSFGDHLQVIAQMIKLELGLHVATLDLGGWDTHDGQNYYLPQLLDELSRGLNALYTDLDGAGAANYTQKLTVVVMSEFGRRIVQNADNGTDHGHGGLMMVLGGNVNGGIHGAWPGLAPGQLFEGIDLAVTTDYRTVLSEILIRRLANNKLGIVFPGFTEYSPLGVVSGDDLPPDFGDGLSLFSDGFESGNLSRWTSST